MDPLQPSNPLPFTPAKSNHLLVNLLVMLCLGLIATTVLFAYQTAKLTQQLTNLEKSLPQANSTPSISPTIADAIDSWETYSNQQLNFSLKHPSTFTVSQDGSSDPSVVVSLEKDNTFPGYHLTTRHLLQIQSYPKATTPLSCYVQSRNNTPLTKSKVINGLTFYYSDRYGGAAAGTHDFNVDNRTIINGICLNFKQIYFESSDWNDPKELELAKADQQSAFDSLTQILSTIKSPVSSISGTTDSWLSYSDTQNGYSVKYPKEIKRSPYQEGNYNGINLLFTGPEQVASGRTQTSLFDGYFLKTLVLPATTNLKDFAEKNRYQNQTSIMEGDVPDISQVSSIKIDGRSSYSYSIAYKDNTTTLFFIPLKSGLLQLVTFNVGKPEATINYQKSLNQIISTLKITN